MNTNIRALSLLMAGFVSVGSAGCAGGSASAGTADESVSDVAGEVRGHDGHENHEDVCPADVPAAVVPPAGHTLKMSLTGLGVQIYMCTAKADVFTWTAVGPQANLLNDDGKLVGTHFIGPTWQGSDASSVVGQKAAGPTVDPTAVPWLLLNAVSHASEAGRFSEVTYIQRLSTVGGLAPTDGCDTAHIGSLAQVPYSAQYVFYEAKAHGKVKRCGG